MFYFFQDVDQFKEKIKSRLYSNEFHNSLLTNATLVTTGSTSDETAIKKNNSDFDIEIQFEYPEPFKIIQTNTPGLYKLQLKNGSYIDIKNLKESILKT